jgi:hypothetical protein
MRKRKGGRGEEGIYRRQRLGTLIAKWVLEWEKRRLGVGNGHVRGGCLWVGVWGEEGVRGECLGEGGWELDYD